MVLWMHKVQMGIQRCARDIAESKGVVFRKANVIRTFFVQKSEAAGRIRVPGMRRNYVESAL